MSANLPAGWAKARLEDVLEPLEDGSIIHQGWSPQCEKTPAQCEQQWGVLKTTAVQDGMFDPTENKRLPDHLVPRPKLEVKKGDLLITCAGPRVRCGVPCLVRHTPRRLMISGKIYRFRVPNGLLCKYYIEALLRAPSTQHKINRMKTGISESGLNLTHARFRNLEVLVAPTNEQTRIVDKIEALMARSARAKEALDAIPALLERYRQSVLAAAFRGDLTADWREQHPDVEPSSVLLERIRVERRRKWMKAETERMRLRGKRVYGDAWKAKYHEAAAHPAPDGEDIPHTWAWASVEQLSTKVVDGVHKKPDYVPQGIPFVTVKNLTAGPKIDFSNLKYVTSEDHEEFIKRAHPEKGDILISKDGTLGVVRAVRSSIDFSIFVSVAMVKPVNPNLADYLEWALSCPQVQRQMVGVGSGLQHIHLKDLRQDMIPIAPALEQKEIVARLRREMDSIDRLCELTRTTRTQVPALDQSILAKAFRGELVPQNPNDEPASTLLARIKAERAANGSAPRGRRRKPASMPMW